MQPFLFMAMDANEFEKKLIGLEKNVSTILELLQGNTLDKSDNGIAGMVNRHDEEIESLKKWRDRFVWTVIGMGLPASVGIIEILKNIFIKH
jgi:hypothetical protein